jgi:hypothetical protein
MDPILLGPIVQHTLAHLPRPGVLHFAGNNCVCAGIDGSGAADSGGGTGSDGGDGIIVTPPDDGDGGWTYGGTFLPLPAVLVYGALSIATSRAIWGSPIWVYNIPQVVNVTIPGSLQFGGTMLNNYPVLRTDFRLVRGVTNEIIFFVRDLDRKPVSLPTSDSLTINIVDPKTDLLLMQRTLTIIDVAKGMYQFATLPAEMDLWPTGPLRWSIGYNRGGVDTVMLWTDQSYSPFSDLVVIDTPTPGPRPTAILTWDDFFPLTNGTPYVNPLLPLTYYSSPLPGAAQYGYANGIQTGVVKLSDFTGTINLEATLLAQPNPDALAPGSPDWFTVLSKDYSAFTGTDPLDQAGNYLWVRWVVVPISGTLTEMAYRV